MTTERDEGVASPVHRGRAGWTARVLLGGALLLAVAGCVTVRPVSLTVASLRCEQDVDPRGVDVPQPALGWRLRSAARGAAQTAYQVLVASSPENLARDRGDLWDSRRVASDRTLDVRYGGAALQSTEAVWWKVRVWDERGRRSAWSAPGTWTMGWLPTSGPWPAPWITDPGLLRRQRRWLGYHSDETANPDTVKWVQLDLGASYAVDEVRLLALRHDVVEGLGFPRRFKVEVSDDATFARATCIADYTREAFPNPWIRDLALPAGGARGRYVRLTATELRVEDGRACLALSQIEVRSGGKNVAAGAAVTASDSWERAPWSAAALTDGLGVPGVNARDNATLLLRREFTVRPGLRRAVLLVCGLGQYVLRLNGARVGDAVFQPGWTDYAKTCLYDTYDLTARLRPGANALGLSLAGGMYNVRPGGYVKFLTAFRPLTATAVLRLEYADGTVETVATDNRWRAAPGPVTMANLYSGEEFDARRVPRGWDRPGFDDAAWMPAVVFPGPGGALRGQSCAAPPITNFEEFQPVKTTVLRPGVTVCDLGQNAALMLRLTVHGPAGATVRVIPAELLAPDGSVDPRSGGGTSWWQYTLDGSGEERWSPQFFYHGGRYLQVECEAPAGAAAAGRPVVDAIAGVMVQSSAPPVGEFACSNELFNRIHALVRWAQRNNMMSVLTDCPHRERLGWLEQDHLNGPALRYEFDLARLFDKTIHDLADAQQPDGLVPGIAPEYVIFTDGFRDSPEWGSACVLVPWQQYEWTGDVEPLRRAFPMMERYVDYLGTRASRNLVDFGLGDWYDVGPNPPGVAQLTPVALTATAFYFQDASLMARVAALLGRSDDAARYGRLAGEIRAAFNRKFFDPATGRYATGSQTAEAVPLVMGLVEPARRADVLAALVKDVRDHGDALTAGDVGYRYLLRALADGGRSDLIFAMNDQSAKPGYGYQLAQGATSLTEAWDASPRSSQDHFMLGQINEWFYHDLAGIQPDPAGPGFKRIVIRPAIVGDLTWVRAAYDSVRGRIACEWRRDGRRLSLDVAIPPNTTATVFVPAATSGTVTEGGRPAGDSPGVRFLRRDGGAAVYAVAAGRYAFASELPAGARAPE